MTTRGPHRSRKNEAINHIPPDNGCDWGIDSCLTCPLSVCRYDCPDDDPDRAYREALALGFARRQAAANTLQQKRAVARRMLDEGATAAEVAAFVNLTADTIRTWRRRWGMGQEMHDTVGRVWPDNTEKREIVRQAIASGMQKQDAAALVGVAPVTVTRWGRVEGWTKGRNQVA